MSRFWYPSYAQLPFRLCPRSEIGHNRPFVIPPPVVPANGPQKGAPRSPVPPTSATVYAPVPSFVCSSAAFRWHSAGQLLPSSVSYHSVGIRKGVLRSGSSSLRMVEA